MKILFWFNGSGGQRRERKVVDFPNIQLEQVNDHHGEIEEALYEWKDSLMSNSEWKRFGWNEHFDPVTLEPLDKYKISDKLVSMNEKPFEYVSRFGTVFTCERCDFRKPIFIETKLSTSRESILLMKDTAEMAGYHACNILPQLNGFSGYDTLQFEFKS